MNNQPQALIDRDNNQLVDEFTREKKIPVVEIFGPTIQGEGPLAGSKTMFVRTGGCDYRCQKCDSLHAVDPRAVKKNARRMTSQEILDELIPVMEKTNTQWVTLSGGNPCMWDFSHVQQGIQKAGFYTAVETQGTLCPDWLRQANMVVCSPKSYGMGEKFEEGKFTDFMTKLRGRTMVALKVVIFSAVDIEMALGMGQMALEIGTVPRGMRFFSLGNSYPPKLKEDLTLSENVQSNSLIPTLMQSYRQLIEEIVTDPRIEDWKFLPQLHVLAYGNEEGR